MTGLTNLQLEKIAKKYLGNHFLGVYPCDSKPKMFPCKNKQSIIFNLSKHNEPGSHYVAIIICHKTIYYFDSYGKKLTNPSIKRILKNINMEIFYHKRAVQPIDSIFCGFYCLAYLIFMHFYYAGNFSSFFDMFFYPPHKKNDNIVTKYILENKKH